jgi:DUF1365 family protein
MSNTSPIASCLYEGFVRHRRHGEKPRAFRFPMFMVYLDLEELPRVMDGMWTWSARRPALAWWRRRDYLGKTGDLAEAVRRTVREAGGGEVRGPIRMLTHLRLFGCCFNPVTFYYCFDRAGERVETIVAEITNTPWKHRHRYVLSSRQGAADSEAPVRFRFSKSFYVSPFLPMEAGYDWTFTAPGERLFVHMNVDGAGGEGGSGGGTRLFDATLLLRRTELSRGSMRRMLVKYPMLTARVIWRIYAEAFGLWRRRVGAFAYPSATAGVRATGGVGVVGRVESVGVSGERV